ncbi:MAG: transporter [Acidobacteriota bacterium]
MTWRTKRRWILALVLLLLVAFHVSARVGGGESYSGGGSSSGSGGGDGGIGIELLYYLFRFLLWLTIEHPVVGIPVDIVVICAAVVWLRKKKGDAAVRISTKQSRRPAAPVARLEELRRFDPNFSEITFSDFCYSLYGRAHFARGKGDLNQYAPYLSESARDTIRKLGPQGLREVRGVVIGAFRVVSVGGMDTDTVTATVALESNYTEVTAAGQQSWYANERWILERRRDILSPPPEKAKADHCPRCGAALTTRTDGSCEYCGVKVESGAFQWYVRAIALVNRETRGPLLTSNVPEQGTGLPTVWQPHFADHRRAFEAEHEGFDWNAFQERVARVAVQLQDAWSARDWEQVRPLETESLFQMHRYWIEAYTRQRLRNIVAGFQITGIEVVKILTDAFYEGVTVRMHAEGRDHTVDDNGNVVAGSKSQLRRWSEYWTFIRSRAAQGTGTASCPNCGAKLSVGATGICEYCGGKLTTGEFDWILSRIEQDESYG